MAEKTKFQFNGQTYSVKGRLCHDIVKYYVEQNPNVTLAALQKAFNTATRMIVATPEMALTIKNSDGKPGGDYYMKEEDRIAIKKGEVVVWSYWPERYFEPFMEQVKALGMNVVIQEQEVKAPADSKEVVAESPLDKAIAKIKKSMKDNGLSVFYLWFPDYEDVMGKLKNIMTKEEYDEDVEWTFGEWYEYGSCDLYCVADSYGDTYDDAYCISAVKYIGNELRFDVVRRYDDDITVEVNITDYDENLTVEQLDRMPAGHENVSVESALEQVTRAINDPDLIDLHKKLFG